MGNLAKLNISGFIEALSSGMYMPFLILFLNQLAGGKLFDATVLIAIYQGLKSVLSPVFGWISDKTGRRGWVILGMLGVPYLLYLLSDVTHLSQLYLLVVLFAVLSAMDSVTSAMVQDMTKGEKQGSAMNWISIITGIGGAIGTALGGNFIELYGFQFVFIVAAGVHLASVLPMLFIKKGGEGQ